MIYLIDYNGNQLKAIDDNSAGDPLYEGAFNFVDVRLNRRNIFMMQMEV